MSEASCEEFPTTRWVLVTGAMRDKDLSQMYPRLRSSLDRVVVTSSQADAALPPDDLAARLGELLDVPVNAVPEVDDALAEAVRLAGPEGSVLVAGSLYLVGAVRAHLAGHTQDRSER